MNGDLKVGVKLLYTLKVRSHWLPNTIEKQTNKAQVSDRFCSYFCLAFDMITYKASSLTHRLVPRKSCVKNVSLGL